MLNHAPEGRRRGAGGGRWLGGALAALCMLPAGAVAQEAAATEAEPAPYLIGKEDVLRVSVYGEAELSASDIPVRPDGKISLPLLGDVVAAGEAPEALGQKLTEMYKAHVRAPSVTVSVAQVNSFKIFIIGSVNNPGVQTLGRETRLLQALAMAGGFGQFANTKRIVLIREESDGQRRIEVNYDRIVSGENMEMNLRLKPGDTIVVP